MDAETPQNVKPDSEEGEESENQSEQLNPHISKDLLKLTGPNSGNLRREGALSGQDSGDIKLWGLEDPLDYGSGGEN